MNILRSCYGKYCIDNVIKNFKFIRHEQYRCAKFKNVIYSTNVHQNYFSHLGGELSPSMRKVIGYWILGCGGLTFGAIVIGGITRLTESGLSMVTWHPFKEFPPLSNKEWINQFELYKMYPEFKLKNQDITLDQFKFIWWIEYLHRMWGRMLGSVFIIPACIFYFKKLIPKKLKIRLMGSAVLIGFQGLLGWYMVKSGLENRFEGENDIPKVSQYRLTAHLGTAFILFTVFLWSGLDLLLPAPKMLCTSKQIKQFRMLSHSAKGLIFVTALSGAMVAGLDAGLVYNSFPKMGDWWVPPEICYINPLWKNIMENPVTVQFIHRLLGTASLIISVFVWINSLKIKLPNRTKWIVRTIPIIALAQTSIGIGNLLYYVPIWLASAHQIMALTLLSSTVWLTHELKWVKKVLK